MNGASATLADAGMGLWLISVTNGMNVYRPMVVKVVPTADSTSGEYSLAETVSATAKPSSVPLTKDADKTTVAFDDTVVFTVKTVVPTYPANAVEKTFNVYDNLPTGLQLVADSIVVKSGSTPLNASSGTTLADYNVLTPAQGEDWELGLEFLCDTINSKLNDAREITITYNAKVTIEAAVGKKIENDAWVKYTNNPYQEDSYKDKHDKEHVYTYGLLVQKTDGTNGIGPAEFTLTKKVRLIC